MWKPLVTMKNGFLKRVVCQKFFLFYATTVSCTYYSLQAYNAFILFSMKPHWRDWRLWEGVRAENLRGIENPSLALSPVKSSQMGLAFILIYIASWEWCFVLTCKNTIQVKWLRYTSDVIHLTPPLFPDLLLCNTVTGVKQNILYQTNCVIVSTTHVTM